MSRGTPQRPVRGSGRVDRRLVLACHARVLFCLALSAICALAGPVRAQPPVPTSAAPTPSSPEAGRSSCLEAHEQSQLLRIDAKLVEARQTLRRCADESCPGVIRADCLKWLDEVGQSIPTVVVVAQSERGDETDVRVSLNGQPWLERLDGRPVELNPGAYTLRFEHSGTPTVEVPVIVRQGEKNRLVTVSLGPKPAPAPPTPRSMAPPSPAPLLPEPPPYRPTPIAVYVLGGVSVVAIGAAVWAGLAAVADRNRAVRECKPLCSDETVSDIRRKALFSDIASATAVASAGTALVLYLLRPAQSRPPGQNTSVGFAPLPEGGMAGFVRMKGPFL